MDSFKSLRLGGTGPRFWHKQTVPFFNFGLFCRSPLLVGPLWFCRLWSRLGCVKVDCLVADSQYGLRLSSFVLNPALMAGLFVGLGFVVVPRALPLWCHSPSPFPLGPLCVPPTPALGQARQRFVYSTLCSGENWLRGGRNVFRVARPVFGEACAQVQVSCPTRILRDPGWVLSARGQGLAARNPLGHTSWPEQTMSCVTTSMDLSTLPLPLAWVHALSTFLEAPPRRGRKWFK